MCGVKLRHHYVYVVYSKFDCIGGSSELFRSLFHVSSATQWKLSDGAIGGLNVFRLRAHIRSVAGVGACLGIPRGKSGRAPPAPSELWKYMRCLRTANEIIEEIFALISM